MTTMMPLRDLELNTRESHLRAVARHFGLKIHPDGMHGLVVYRDLVTDGGAYLGRLVYRAEMREDVVA